MKHVTLWTVLKLRLQLWWEFLLEGDVHHFKLKVRPLKNSAIYPRAARWMWVCVVDPNEQIKLGMHSRGEYALGSLRQWTLQEALSLAARKAEWVLYPEREPVKEPEPNPEKPKHMKVYRLLDGGLIGIECWCGWHAPFPKCHPERDSADRCENCRIQEEHYDRHVAEERYKAEHQTESTTT